MCLSLFMMTLNLHDNPKKYYEFLFIDMKSKALERLNH